MIILRQKKYSRFLSKLIYGAGKGVNNIYTGVADFAKSSDAAIKNTFGNSRIPFIPKETKPLISDRNLKQASVFFGKNPRYGVETAANKIGEVAFKGDGLEISNTNFLGGGKGVFESISPYIF